MATPSYSYRIFNGHLTSGAQHGLNPVPMGFRLVIRNIWLIQAPAAGVHLEIWLGPFAYTLAHLAVPTGATYTTAETRLVLHEGEAAGLFAVGAAATIGLYGYLFTGAGAALNPPVFSIGAPPPVVGAGPRPGLGGPQRP